MSRKKNCYLFGVIILFAIFFSVFVIIVGEKGSRQTDTTNSGSNVEMEENMEQCQIVKPKLERGQETGV